MDTPEKLLLQATGRNEGHLVEVDGLEGLFHRGMVEDLLRLRSAAAKAGFGLAVASSYRSFDRQFSIWQAKASGQRPLLDVQGQPLELATLTAEQCLWAIVRWSALPGASRHHWGTDIDVFDSRAVADDYRLQLVPQEYSDGGPFAAFSGWLDEQIEKQQAFGFFRPYVEDIGGVAPEPWHLSYRPLADVYQAQLTPEHLLPLWRSVSLPLLDQVEGHVDALFARCIQCSVYV